jgi:hypothetical protein
MGLRLGLVCLLMGWGSMAGAQAPKKKRPSVPPAVNLVTVSVVGVHGKLTVRQVGTVLTQHSKRFNRCRLGANAHRARLNLNIDANGKIVSAQIIGVQALKTKACLEKELPSLQFPKAAGPTAAKIDLAIGSAVELAALEVPKVEAKALGGLGGGGSADGVFTTKGKVAGPVGRAPRRPRALVKLGKPSVAGGMTRANVRRVIRRYQNLLRYCYERELQRKPRLKGTVISKFTINGEGRVATVKASGLGNRTVESCIARGIKRMQFPKPRGGGLVNVSYPLRFYTR